MTDDRTALKNLYQATLHYLAEHDGYAGYAYLEAAILEAEHVLFEGRRTCVPVWLNDWQLLKSDENNKT